MVTLSQVPRSQRAPPLLLLSSLQPLQPLTLPPSPRALPGLLLSQVPLTPCSQLVPPLLLLSSSPLVPTEPLLAPAAPSFLLHLPPSLALTRPPVLQLLTLPPSPRALPGLLLPPSLSA